MKNPNLNSPFRLGILHVLSESPVPVQKSFLLMFYGQYYPSLNEYIQQYDSSLDLVLRRVLKHTFMLIMAGPTPKTNSTTL